MVATQGLIISQIIISPDVIFNDKIAIEFTMNHCLFRDVLYFGINCTANTSNPQRDKKDNIFIDVNQIVNIPATRAPNL